MVEKSNLAEMTPRPPDLLSQVGCRQVTSPVALACLVVVLLPKAGQPSSASSIGVTAGCEYTRQRTSLRGSLSYMLKRSRRRAPAWCPSWFATSGRATPGARGVGQTSELDGSLTRTV